MTNRHPASLPPPRTSCGWLAAALRTAALVAALCGLATNAAETPAAPPKLDFTPNLPLVYLDSPQPIGSASVVTGTARIELPTGRTGGATNALPARLRYHGSSSQGYEKKSFAVALDAPAQLLDLQQGRNWVLQAAYVDRSLMRHKLSYDLFLALNTTNSPRMASSSRFVEVIVNGRYRGIYLLMERVDGHLLKFAPFRADEAAHACLYKAADHAANFSGNGRGGYDQREPEPAAHLYYEPIEKLDRFVSASSDADFRHPETGIGSRLDLSNAMDFHALVLLTSNSDGITKNFFIGRAAQATGPVRQKFFFVPWDYDGTFGRNWDGRPYPHNQWLSNGLFDRLLQWPEYRQQFAARWQQLRAGPFALAAIRKMMDDNVRTLGPAVARNVQRWSTTHGQYPDQLTFDEDLAQMKAWTEKHLQWLDGRIAQLARAKQ